MNYRAEYREGTLRLITNQLPPLDEGERVSVEIERGRSMRSHNHQFAEIHDAWLNLPEHLMNRTWAETADKLRKHALIATGYNQSVTLECGSRENAMKMKAALIAANIKGYGYSVGQVKGTTVTVWTPESQSVKAMGGKRFQESKTAVLEWIAAQIGVEPSGFAA